MDDSPEHGGEISRVSGGEHPIGLGTSGGFSQQFFHALNLLQLGGSWIPGIAHRWIVDEGESVWVLRSEANVCASLSVERVLAWLCLRDSGFLRIGEASHAFGAEVLQQRLLVREVMIRSLVAHPSSAGQFPHADGHRWCLMKHVETGGPEGRQKTAVMIGLFR